MAGRGKGPDFVEALARGLDILAAFGVETIPPPPDSNFGGLRMSGKMLRVPLSGSISKPSAMRDCFAGSGTQKPVSYILSGFKMRRSRYSSSDSPE